jgi:hypothetical protein
VTTFRAHHLPWLVVALAVVGCGQPSQRQPPGRPPTPRTVNRSDPGGDAHDPHLAALRRQLDQGWARRADKDHQIEVPLPDTRHWKRVRYRGVEHLTGFRYGDDHHVVAIAFVVDMSDADSFDSQRCMRRFEAWARPRARSYGVEHEPIGSAATRWREGNVVIRFVDGHVDAMLKRKRFSAAWAAYPAYEHGCLVYGIAAQWNGHGEVARAVRDRFVVEAFGEVKVLTTTKPYRH